MPKQNLQELFDRQANAHKSVHYAVSEQTKEQMKVSHIGREGVPNSPETRAKMSASLKGREVWNKGIPATEERKANISKAKAGKPNPKKWKPIMTPNGQFSSQKAVAEAAGVSYQTVWNWMKRWPDQYYYINNDEQS